LQVAFDSNRQVQVMGFLVQRPRNATDYCEVHKRSVA
jgi:ribulose bisphosphate carboxylase small subunit